jgi:hypothetical protein
MSIYFREGNTILARDTQGNPYKVAVINSKGYLQPAKGMVDHRRGIEAFLADDRIPEEAPAAPVNDVIPVTPVTLPAVPRSSGIPPCPAEDPAAGDKTPAVIAWWHRYHPEAAAARYKGRKFAMPDAE